MEARLLEYSRRDSLFHRMDARWKLVAVAVATVSVLGLPSVSATAVASLGALTLLAMSHLPAAWFLSRLSAVGAFLLFVVILLPVTMPGDEVGMGPLRVSEAGVRLAGLISLKALTVIALALFVFATTPFDTMLKAGARLRVPNLFLQLLMLSFRYVFLFGAELGKLRIALRTRGYRNRATAHSYRTIGRVSGTLLVRSYERAERVANAMRCRGFDGRFRSLHAFATRTADVLAFGGLVLSLAVLPWLVDFALQV